ncbi:MAG: hypothetical protein DMG26_18720 [Acidobacteria bacterium]|nr:MAG: hypothetical protein DMG26_18720 [Acidobacteriota bacterium]
MTSFRQAVSRRQAAVGSFRWPLRALLLPVAACLLPTAFCLLLTADCLLPAYCAPHDPPAQASQPSAQPAPSSRPAIIDPKAQELLDKVIQAMGGPAFLHFKTLTTHGRAFSISNEETTGLAPYDSFVEYPDKRRFSYGKKKPVILINNGDSAWELDRYGVILQPPEQVRRWKITNRYSLENLLRLRIREPGILIQMGGVDFVDNLPARVVEIVDASQVHIKLYVNRVSLRPVRVTYQVLNPQSQEQDEYADDYSDYQVIQGIATPMHIGRFVNDERVAEIFRSSARYDESYPPSYFSQPSGQSVSE